MLRSLFRKSKKSSRINSFFPTRISSHLHVHNRRLLCEPLEDRRLLSVAPLNVVLISDAVAQAQQIRAAAAIDTIAIVYHADNITTSGLVNLLDSVSAAHNGAPIGHLGIVAHGGPGEVDLGKGDDLSLPTLPSQAAGLAQLRSVFTNHAEIDLYSCSVAAGAGGKTFVDEFAADTGAAVFASDNPVGTVPGADLVWEYESGHGAATKELFITQQLSAIPQLLLAVPATPTLVGPGSSSSPGPVLTSTSQTLSWNQASGATGYGVYVQDITTGLSGPFVYSNDAVGNVTQLALPSGTLVSGHSYAWNIWATNSAGHAASAPYYFQVNTTTVPATPTLVGPGSSSSPGPVLTSTSQTLSWNQASGATGYGVYVQDITTGLSGPFVYSNDAVGNVTQLALPAGTLVSGHSYAWNIWATNSAGHTASAPYYFQVNTTTVPATPTLVGPGSSSSPGPVLTSTSQTLSWNQASGATGYGVYVQDITTGLSGPFVYSNDAVGNVTQLALPAGTLVSGHSYAWNIWATNSAGHAASAPYYFQVNTTTVPATPTLVGPGSSSSPGPVLTSTSQTLSWNQASGATGYGVYVQDITTGLSGPFVYSNDAVGNVTQLALPAGTLVSGHSYAWNIWATNSAGHTASAPYYFQVNTTTVPATPTLVGPGSSSSPGPVLTSTSQTLQWNQATGATGYGVYVQDITTGLSGPFVYSNDAVGNVTQLALPSGTLVSGHSYAWNIWATNSAGHTASAPYYFQVNTTTVPATPTLVGPGSSSSPGPVLTSTSQTLQWNQATGATGYGVYVQDITTGLSGPFVYSNDAVGNVTQLALPSGTLVSGHSYAWNIWATNSAGHTASAPYYFQVNTTTVPATPTLVGPGSSSSPGPVLTSTSQTLQWNQATGATGYGVYVQDITTGLSGPFVYSNDAVGNVTQLALPSGTLVSGHSYAWNIWATNSAGHTASAPYYFQVNTTTVPATPTLVGPGSSSSPGPVLTSTSQTLQWNQATGATGYGVYVQDITTGLSGPFVYSNDAVGNVTQLALPSGTLVSGHSYAWNIWATNSAGHTASAPYYFQVNTTTVPATPTLVGPGSSSSPGPVLTSTSQTLSWNQASGATGYGVYVQDITTGLSGPFVYSNDAVGNVTQLALPSGTLVSGHSYAWNIWATNSAGHAASAPYYFQVNTTTVPATPTLVGPGSSSSPGPVLTSTSQTLQWNQATGATGYGVYVQDITTGLSGPFVYSNDAVGNVTQLALPSGTLVSGHSYAWNIWATNSAGHAASAPYYFQVNTTTVPATPTLVGPGSSSSPGPVLTSTSQTLQWNQATGATGYGVYVQDITTGLSGPFVYSNDAVGNVTQLALPSGTLVSGHSYAWNIWATNSAGHTASAPYYFQVNTTTVPAVTVTSPNGGDTWAIGVAHTINWTVSGDTSQINNFLVSYSLDGGTTYQNDVGTALIDPCLAIDPYFFLLKRIFLTVHTLFT